eukprot:750004-Hanusia_phi.AAC.1
MERGSKPERWVTGGDGDVRGRERGVEELQQHHHLPYDDSREGEPRTCRCGPPVDGEEALVG